MEKNKISIEINGRNYTLCGEEPADYLFRVGKYVDDKLSVLSAANPMLSTTDAAVLVAVNIADELLRLRDGHSEMDERIAQIIKESKASQAEEKRQEMLPKLPVDKK